MWRCKAQWPGHSSCSRDGTMDAPLQEMIEHRLCAGARTHMGLNVWALLSGSLTGEQKIQGEKRLRSAGVTSGQVTLELGRKENAKSGKLCVSHNSSVHSSPRWEKGSMILSSLASQSWYEAPKKLDSHQCWKVQHTPNTKGAWEARTW